MKKHTILALVASLIVGGLFAADTIAKINPAEKAGELAAAAIERGDLAVASGWADVQLKLAAASYVGPIGDLLAQFKGQVRNLPAFIAATKVDLGAPPSSRYGSPWDDQTAAAVLANDVPAFRLAVVKSAIWRATMGKSTWTGDDPTPAQLQAYKDWIDGGMAGTTPYHFQDMASVEGAMIRGRKALEDAAAEFAVSPAPAVLK